MEYYETIHIIPLSLPHKVISSDDNVLMNDSQHEGSYNISVNISANWQNYQETI
jgi:hypothetical protein